MLDVVCVLSSLVLPCPALPCLVLPCPALSSPALPCPLASQPVSFSPTGWFLFVCLFCLLLLINPFNLLHLGPRPLPSSIPDTGDPLLGGPKQRTTVNFYTTGKLCGHKHLMPTLGKANCAFPGPHSEKEEDRRQQPLSLKVPRRKQDDRGYFPNYIPPKGM